MKLQQETVVWLEIAGVVLAGIVAALGVVFSQRKSERGANTNAPDARLEIRNAFSNLTAFGWVAFSAGVIGACYAAFAIWYAANQAPEKQRRESIAQLAGIELHPQVSVLLRLRQPLQSTPETIKAEKRFIIDGYKNVSFSEQPDLWLLTSREVREVLFPGVTWNAPTPRGSNWQYIAGLRLTWGALITPQIHFRSDAVAYALPGPSADRAKIGAEGFRAEIQTGERSVSIQTYNNQPVSADAVMAALRKDSEVARLWFVTDDNSRMLLEKGRAKWQQEMLGATLCISVNKRTGQWIVASAALGNATIETRHEDYVELPLILNADPELVTMSNVAKAPLACGE